MITPVETAIIGLTIALLVMVGVNLALIYKRLSEVDEVKREIAARRTGGDGERQ